MDMRMLLLLPVLLAGPSSLSTLAADAQSPLLPQAMVDTVITGNGTLIRVAAGDDLQAAITRALPGDTIELQAGAVFTGPFTLPAKGGQQWITLQPSAGLAALPAAGVRVTPDDARAMAHLQSASGFVVLAAPGAHHYRFVGIEFSPAATGVFLQALVVLGQDVDDIAAMPHHFIFERCYLHGDAVVGSRRGLVMNSATTAVHDSWLSDFKMRDEDSQAIIGWAGSGPYAIVNNYLEAAGENLMFGGADPLIARLVPADIEIRGNRFTKPPAWKSGEPGFADTRWTIKNLLELKNARRVLIDGNVFEHNWNQAQNGYAILFTVRNQQGTAPWSVVEDITFSNNIVREVANGINLLGTDDNFPSRQTRRISISNNLFDNVGGRWGEGNLLQLLDGVEAARVEHNTAINSGKILMSEGRPHRDFVLRGNIVLHNEYGVIGTGTAAGNDTLLRYFRNVNLRDNVIIGGRAASYPSGNVFPVNTAAVGFVDIAAGDYRLLPSSRYLRQARGVAPGIDAVALCRALQYSDRPAFCDAALEELP